MVHAQVPSTYGKNAFSINLTKLAVSEINLSYERFLSSRRSIEFGVGLVYANSFLEDQTKDWTNAALFIEHGYAGRFHYKIFKRPEINSKWRDYISTGIVFKNLYYNDQPIYTGIKPDMLTYDSIIGFYTTNDNPQKIDTLIYTRGDTVYYNEDFLEKRSRIKFGIQFLWGKVYEVSQTLAFEFYFGAGIDLTFATRTDHSRYATYRTKKYEFERDLPGTPDPTDTETLYVTDDNKRRNQSIPDYIDKSFYARPTIQVGVKLRLRM